MRLYYPDALSPEANAYERERWHYERAKRKGLRISPPPQRPKPDTPPPWAFGWDLTTHEYVTLSPDQRGNLTHCIAIPGAGKTNLAETLAVEDARHDMGLFFLDPAGDVIQHLAWRILEETNRPPEDIILIEIADSQYSVSLPLCGHVNPSNHQAYQRQINQFVHVFEANWGTEGADVVAWGAQLAQFLRNIAHLIVANPDTSIADVPDILTEPEVRERLLRAVLNREVHHFWEKQFARWPERLRQDRVQSTLNKVDAFLTDETVLRIVAQPEGKLHFRQLIDEHKIVLISLAKSIIEESATSLLGSIIIGEVLTAGFSRADTPEKERYPVSLYIDELELFQTPDVHRLIEQARKYGIQVLEFHQDIEQLSRKNQAAAMMAQSFLGGRISPTNAALIAMKYDNTPEPEEPKLEPVKVRSPNRPQHWEHAATYYGVGRSAERVGLYDLVEGDPLSTQEMRHRKENTLINLPDFEFEVVLKRGREPYQTRVRALPSPCYGREMPNWIADQIELIRERCRQDYCTRPKGESSPPTAGPTSEGTNGTSSRTAPPPRIGTLVLDDPEPVD